MRVAHFRAGVRVYVAIVVAILPTAASAEEAVYFADGRLKVAVEQALGVTAPKPSDMLSLTGLDVSNGGILSLAGLEYALNLTNLNVMNGNIGDISALAGLTNLASLHLSENPIHDLSPLSALTNLTDLDLWCCTQISDIAPLADLTNLTHLSCADTQISDISALSGLTRLRVLILYDNQISDLSPLSAMTNLEELGLLGNPLNSEACSIYIPLLMANNPGVEILYDSCSVQTYTLSISASDGGSVTVPGEGSFQYEQDASVSITAVAETGYYFVNWTGTAVTAGKVADPMSASTTVTLSEDYTLVANFAIENIEQFEVYPTLAISSSDGGSVTEPGEGSHMYMYYTWESGVSVSVVAVADPGYYFVNWTGTAVAAGNVADPTSASTTVMLSADCTLVANFAVDGYLLTIDMTGWGSVTSPGEGVFLFGRGEIVSVVAVADPGNHFVNWTGTAVSAGKVADPTSASTTVTVSADYTLSANFVADGPTECTLTVSSTNGGSVTVPGEGVFEYDQEASVPIVATASAGYHFVNWTGTAVNAGKVADPTSANTTVTVSADYTLVANFEAAAVQQEWVLTVSAGAGGSVSSPGVGRFEYDDGTSVSLRAQANSGYHFVHWSGNIYSTNNPTTIQMNSDLSVKANFEKDVPVVSRSTLTGLVLRLNAQGKSKGPLSGATVSLTGPSTKTVTTDSQGEFAFTGLNAGTFSVTVSKSGYYSVTRSVQLAQGDTRNETFKLMPQSSAPTAFDFSSPNGKHFIPGIPGNLKFGVTVAWNGEPGSVRFKVAGTWRNATITDLGGGKALASLMIPAPSAVSSCSEVTLEVTNREGKTTYLNTGVRFSPIPGIVVLWYRDNILWTPSGLTLTYLDELSCLQGLTLPLGIASLNYYQGEQRRLTYDLLAGAFSGSRGGFGKFGLGITAPNKWEALGEGRVEKNGTLRIAFTGCDSPTISPGWSLSFSGKAGVGAPAVVVLDIIVPGLGSTLSYLPVIGNVKVRLYVIAGGKISGEYAGGRPGNCYLGSTSVENAATFGVEAQAVLDLKVTGAGVYVGGTGTPEWEVCPDFKFQAVTLRAYVGVYAWAPLFYFRQEYGAELRFEADGKTKMPGMSELPRSIAHRLSGSGLMDDILWAQEDELPWSPMDAGYLRWGAANRIAQKREPGGITILSAEDATVLGEEIVAANVTNLAAPTVVAGPAQTVVLFTLHDPNKPWYAATDIGVATKASDGEWALDRIADDDAAEFEPEIIGTEPAFVAWTRISGDISGTAGPDEVTPHLDIVTARLDQSTGLWTVPEQLTSNSVVDRDPLPVVFGPTQGILWIQNQGQASIGDANNGDRLLFAKWDGAAWQTPETLWSGPKGIMDFAFVADSAGEGHVVLTIDEDGDLGTTGDSELYVLATLSGVWQEALRLTEDGVEDSSPALLTPKGVPMCVWDANGTATYSRLDQWNPRAVYSETTDANDCLALAGVTLPVGGAIAYTTQGPNGVDIVASFYDADLDLWSQPRQLTHDEHAESALSLTCDGNDLVLAYLKTLTVREDMDVEINGQMTHLENVPQPGRVDLCMLRHTPARDLAVVPESIVLGPNNPAPGQASTITAVIENRGDLPVQDATVAFYDGDPDGEGTLIGSTQRLVQPLIAGGMAQASVSWTVPADDRSHRIFVVVDADPTIDDRDWTNNTASLTSVLADLEAETCWSEEIDSTKVALTARIINAGVVSVGTFDVSWRLGNPNGLEIATSRIDGLAGGATYEVAFTWDTRGYLDENLDALVFAVVDVTQLVTEFDETNNLVSCAVYLSPVEEDPEEIVLPGLLAHWTFDEGVGTVAEDSAGGRLGEVHGASWTPGITGNALRFDGMNDYVDCGSTDGLAPGTATVSVWMQGESFGCDMYLVGKTDSVGFSCDYTLAVKPDATAELFFGESGQNYVRLRGKSVMTAGDWNHIAATRDGEIACLYANGQLDVSTTYSFSFGTSDKGQGLKIGAYGSDPAGFFKGAIDDVQIYDAALAADEIQDLYEASLQ
ncbi:MAG: leucine-rich repeat domain-containing protein [Phycisphaerae bacterium]|nr:leucine-rich repeat domain-containing protein [Phycisphaerae bacterium]